MTGRTAAAGAALVMGVMIMTSEARALAPKLTCAAEKTARGLEVSFRFENIGDEDVYVFEFFEDAGAYVLRNYDAVLIARQALRPPPFVRLSAPKVPPVTVVAAKGVLTGKLRLPWPLVEDHPFRMGEKGRPVELERVQCALGYFPVAAKIGLMKVQMNGTPREVPSLWDALAAQTVVKSAYLDLE